MSRQLRNSFQASYHKIRSNDVLKQPTVKISVKNENIATKNNNNNNSRQSAFIEEMKELEREADKQSVEVELSDCVEFVSQLVDLFKHAIIMPELEPEDDWHDDVRRQLKRKKGTTGNSLLDDKIERIASEKGLTKEQWKSLCYINFTAGDTLEMTTVSRSHLKKVHDMASRLLVGEEQAPVFALVDAIERYMPKNHLTQR
ncbi:unnamed protein product [Rotaria socialis]|uniref:Uncharacterized protein n=1 Tax=Rotaria socialis TaxID=392032 RepID=A0A819ACR7_9BILA|nr:unnamed protein product [Rotaria socialis]CAF3775908.1 unnamed protein product [Rotaria socialis]CAF4120941.1 unnamed protein product [Rotaria socialis]CAF4698714.1 unnamed protein product [Rotaria socialis]